MDASPTPPRPAAAPTSLDAPASPARAPGPYVRVLEIIPPQTLPPDDARAIAALAGVDDPIDIAWLMKEPKQKDSFGLVASIDWQICGWMKLQHGRRGELWLRALVAAKSHPDEIRAALVAHARRQMGNHEQLVAEVAEADTDGQLELARLGLECQLPRLRSRRQVDRGVYEFRSFVAPKITHFGKPRFTWPPS